MVKKFNIIDHRITICPLCFQKVKFFFTDTISYIKCVNFNNVIFKKEFKKVEKNSEVSYFSKYDNLQKNRPVKKLTYMFLRPKYIKMNKLRFDNKMMQHSISIIDSKKPEHNFYLCINRECGYYLSVIQIQNDYTSK